MGLFETSLKQLNEQQRTAVETINGPVLVVAGPGTGKTQLLSMRVANIIRQTDTDPGSILCLTFTNKAALNMRERIISLTGGEAKGVMVKTFHSFAAELMNMYPDQFWNGARLRNAPDAVQTDIIQTILGSLPLNNPLAVTFAGKFTAGKDVKNALKYAKEAGLTPDQLHAIVSANLAYIDSIEQQLVDIVRAPLRANKLNDLQARIGDLPPQGIANSMQPLQDLAQTIRQSLDFALSQDHGSGKTTQTGKWKQRWIQTVDGEKGMHKERQRNIWWLELANVYQQYRQELHTRGYYDYADMIVEVLSQLQKSPTMRADVQERFLYILVDEFQDTNAAQLQLANLVAGQQDIDSPNIMVVGDDDQSIYKFNGAELNNLLSFTTSYPNAAVIVLTDNYRSSQEILNASSQIIGRVTDRLVNRMAGLQKDLRAKNPPSSPSQLAHLSYPTEEHQLSEVARRIATEFKTGSGSIAVLSRGHENLRRLAAILHAHEVPISYEQQSNILDHEIVRHIYTLGLLVQAIAAGDTEKVTVLLSDVLRAPMWNIGPETLWELALTANKKDWLSRLMDHHDTYLQQVAHWLLWLAKEVYNQPLLVVIEHLLGLRSGEHMTSPITQFYMGDSHANSEYLRALSAIRVLLGMVNEFSNDDARIDDFTQFIHVTLESGDVIADESAFVTGDRAVHLLTVHKAKGLEFDTVHIIGAVDNNWRPSVTGRKCPANLPLQPVGDDDDDYARLMFVATTRARQHLYAHSFKEDANGKEVLATPLLADILPVKEADLSVDPITVLQENLRWPHLSSADEKRNLMPVLENFSLSATALLDFLDVSQGGPERFFERHLLHLPAAKSPQMAFGIAMHAALEFAQLSTNKGNLDPQKVIETYQDNLSQQQLPVSENARYQSHGVDLIQSLLDSDTFWLGKGDLPEQSLNDLRVGQARLKGTIDRIHQTRDQLVIIDYKTGAPLSSFTTRDRTKSIKAWRHRMQLIFYTILVSESKRYKTPTIEGQMWYLEASSAKELIRSYIPTQEELARTKQLISIVWQKIQELNLPDISNYSNDYIGIQNFENDLLDGTV